MGSIVGPNSRFRGAAAAAAGIICWFGIAPAILAIASLCGTALAADLRLEMAAGPPEVVFDPAREGCGPNDLPDDGARAFRDASGLIHLIASHFENRQLIGPDFAHLRHPCAPILMSREDPDPAKFNDSSWLTSFYTADGHTVYALIHNEYQGYRYSSELCPSRQYGPCWENSVLATLSTDDGNHFRTPVVPRDLVATAPTRYIGEAAKGPIGYFQPSNIVKRDDYYYVLIKAEHFGNQIRGNCLFRTADLSDARSWRAWDGHGFTVSFPDPYREPMPDPPSACAPVGLEHGFGTTVMSLTFDTVSRLYIATVETVASTRVPLGGTYYATSPDLIGWTGVSTLWETPLAWTHTTCESETTADYASLIDHAAADRNFAVVSAHPNLYLYYTAQEFRGCGGPRARSLMRRAVTISR